MKRLGQFLGPIVIVNQGGFYDPLLALFDRFIEERFMNARHAEMWQVVDSVEAGSNASLGGEFKPGSNSPLAYRR